MLSQVRVWSGNGNVNGVPFQGDRVSCVGMARRSESPPDRLCRVGFGDGHLGAFAGGRFHRAQECV
jgi:hypothetical protein